MRKAVGKQSGARIRIGISRCLLGDAVRFDGGHKHDRFLTETLGHYFEWIPVCPEMEAGMGAPRESVRLVAYPEGLRMEGVRSKTDFTRPMKEYSLTKIKDLQNETLHGFILKKDSPSCGMERVRIYQASGNALKQGSGLFAAELLSRFPDLPVEEEGRLQDMRLRENFIERVFAFHRWSEFVKSKPRPADLVKFHTRHKLTLLSHDRASYQKMGQLVAGAGRGGFSGVLEDYGSMFMQALKHHATPKKHANVLYHLLGYLKKSLDAADKEEMIACIEAYRNEALPLIVPVTLLLHHFRRYPSDWVMAQTYLNPYPAELMLRNHV